MADIMKPMETMQILMVVTVFVFAGSVKGVTGMGLPTVAVSLLGLWMPPTQAAALLVVPSLVTNLRQCLGPHLRPLAARLWPGWVALALVTVFAPGLGETESAGSANRWLGGVLVCYGLWGLRRPVLPDFTRCGWLVGAAAGAATGAIAALTAVFVLPWVPYLQTLRLEKGAMVQAMGLSFTVATLALAVRLLASAHVGWWSTSSVLALGGALAGALAGMKLGEVLRSRLSVPAFQRALFLVLIALGVANLAHTV